MTGYGDGRRSGTASAVVAKRERRAPSTDPNVTANALAASLGDLVLPRLRERHGVPSFDAQTVDERESVPANATATAGHGHHDIASPFAEQEIEAFCAALIADGDDGWRARFAQLCDRAADRRVVRLALLVPTAHLLGRMWTDDEASMVDVTIATARLQSALESVEPRPRDGARGRVLLVPAPGDTHVFGLLMLSDELREAGWSVHVELRVGRRTLLRHAERGGFDAIGVGIGAGRYAQAAIAALRTVAKLDAANRPVLIVGGAGTIGIETDFHKAGAEAVVGPPDDADAVLSTLLAGRPQGVRAAAHATS